MGQWGHDRSHKAGGTSPEVMQQCIDAMYYNARSNPVVKGGHASGRGDLKYAFAGGVGIIRTGAGAMMVTWPAGVTELVTQPSVDRVDVIYVDDSGQVGVSPEGQVTESAVCILDKMRLPAGSTATSRASRAVNRRYALPYGSSLGWLLGYGEIQPGVAVPTSAQMYQGKFWVPTDRWVDIHVDHAIFHRGGPTEIGYVRYEIHLDGSLIHTFELPYHAGYLPEYFTMKRLHVSEGEHTLLVRRINRVGPDAWFFGGGSEKLAGGFVGVEDKGVAE